MLGPACEGSVSVGPALSGPKIVEKEMDMKRALSRVALVAVIGSMLGSVGVSPGLAATTAEVGVDDYVFEPATERIAVGGAVHWLTDPGSLSEHNVRENGGIFRSGDPTLAVDYTVTFSAGTFNYFCEPHLGQGMVGKVKVPATVVAAPTGAPFTVRWATSASDSGETFDVSYRVAGGAWKTWKGATSARKAVFGRDGKPVRVRSGTTYAFKVRSRGAGAVSAWSPVVEFTP